MTIEDLMYYGRYYDFEDKGYHLWWFEPFDGKIYPFDELVNDFGYSSQEDIISSGRFIPLFETDIVKSEQEFLKQYGLEIEQPEDSDDIDFDTKFKMLIDRNDLWKSWHSFEYRTLYRDAIAWCNKNHIGDDVIVR